MTERIDHMNKSLNLVTVFVKIARFHQDTDERFKNMSYHSVMHYFFWGIQLQLNIQSINVLVLSINNYL